MTAQELQRNIMRRVYYAYALGVISHPAFVHGLFMSGLLFAFTRFVSVPDVLRNLANVEVGQVAGYLYGSLFQTESWTLIISGAFVALLFSLVRQIRASRTRSWRTI